MKIFSSCERGPYCCGILPPVFLRERPNFTFGLAGHERVKFRRGLKIASAQRPERQVWAEAVQCDAI
jgi:hypothetical protein